MNSSLALLRSALAALCLATLAAGTHAQPKAAAKPDPAKGKDIAGGACAACHGADGNSTIPANPKLAGQHAEYLVKQLADYARPPTDKTARVNGIMAGFAAGLSADDRRHVAAWFASQSKSPGAASNKETLALGQRIWRAGLAEKNVPACAGCHGPTGAGVPIQYPRIAGQWADYTESQLKAFAAGTRRNNGSMMEISARLSEAEMKAVADYAAGLR